MRLNRSLFSTSQFVTTEQGGTLLRSILRESNRRTNPRTAADSGAKPSDMNKTLPRIALVGQSISNDVANLRGPPLEMDLHDPSNVGIGITSIYDTLAFTQAAQTARDKLGDSPTSPRIPGRLGPLVAFLGVDPSYSNAQGTNVSGTHNAGNDAAYTMMALLLYALQWKDVTKGTALPRRLPVRSGEKVRSRKSERPFIVRLAGAAASVAALAALYGSADMSIRVA